MLERERKIAIRLLITGSGVRVPHNPLKELLHCLDVLTLYTQFICLLFFCGTLLVLFTNKTYSQSIPFDCDRSGSCYRTVLPPLRNSVNRAIS